MITFPGARADGTRESGVLNFDRCRRWFNDTYGWSQDVEMQGPMRQAQLSGFETESVEINPQWAYNIKYNDYRIYVKDDSILTMFQLKWK
jgi:hypothetical protein